MSVFKDEKTNKWYAMVRFTDWQGQRKQKCKRGFATRRDALEWEKVFQITMRSIIRPRQDTPRQTNCFCNLLDWQSDGNFAPHTLELRLKAGA